MNVYIYTEVTRKVKGEEQQFLSPVAELEDFESVEQALEALVDEAPEFMGAEFVIFTEAPEYITVAEPETKYSFKRRDNGADAEQEEEADEEAPEDEEEYEEEGDGEEEAEDEEEGDEEAEEEEAPAPKRQAKKRPAKKPPAKKRPAAKQTAKSGARAGTRTGSSKRTPFTRNPASAE